MGIFVCTKPQSDVVQLMILHIRESKTGLSEDLFRFEYQFSYFHTRKNQGLLNVG
jgi:hypothetical protein